MIPNLKNLMKRTWPYGTTYNVVVDSSSAQMIAVICHDIKEGFLLANHGMQKLPAKGDKGTIVFTEGGPLGGYWKFFKETK